MQQQDYDEKIATLKGNHEDQINKLETDFKKEKQQL